jgi:Winged helix DNA-binding domain
VNALQVARRRLRNSRLTGTRFQSPDEAVRWHLAMQAQDYGPAKWSIGQRSTGLVDGDLDAALAEGSIVRTHVLRPTWHFVARDDIRWLLALSGPRVQQGNGSRYRDLGLDERTRARGERAIASALEGGNRLTRNELGAVLDDAGIDREGQRLPYFLMHCELEAVICSGGLSGKQHTYALLDEQVPGTVGRFDRDEALAELTRRYLQSHGPATVKDLGWWSGLTMADIRRGMDLLGSEVRSDTVDGVVLWSGAEDVASARDRGAHLIQTYDEVVVGYTESRFLGDPALERAKAAWTGGSDIPLPTGGVMLHGRIAGHWRRTLSPTRIDVEVHLYQEPTQGDARAVGAAAAELGRFFGREVVLETKRIRARRASRR